MNEGFMGLLSRPRLKSGGNNLRRQRSGTLSILSNYAQSVLATAHSRHQILVALGSIDSRALHIYSLLAAYPHAVLDIAT